MTAEPMNPQPPVTSTRSGLRTGGLTSSLLPQAAAQLGQRIAAPIALGKDGIGHRPSHTDVRIVVGEAALGGGVVVTAHLVENVGAVAQHAKAVGKPH